MMQCPSCSAPLLSGEARCVSCHALVNPQGQGSSALAPRLVTPQSLEGVGGPVDLVGSPESEAPLTPAPATRNSEDEAWRREVLERVRKRRQLRTHAMPLFVEGAAPKPSAPAEPPAEIPVAAAPVVSYPESAPFEHVVEELPDTFEDVAPLPPTEAPDLLASLGVPLGNPAEDDPVADLPLRPAEVETPVTPAPILVERPRPTLVSNPQATRSLVKDMPLVEPTRVEAPPAELPPRRPASAVSSRAASMTDRMQAAFIDIGMWSAMCATAFYFASRIARTSILGLGSAWSGLALFAAVLGAAYILFFGGLSGATPGKIACGIQVRRYDGSSLGPLASLGRGLLGIIGIAALGVSVWPAFWDRDRRTLHDRATDSRVTIV
jgi:uncharacterized RDD family membrane protein YckC